MDGNKLANETAAQVTETTIEVPIQSSWVEEVPKEIYHGGIAIGTILALTCLIRGATEFVKACRS